MSDLPPTEVDTASDPALTAATVDASSPVVPPPVEMTTAPAVELAPAGAAFSPHELELLNAIGTAARENNDTGAVRDDAGRLWEIMPDVVESHSVILVRMTEGGTVKVRNISTVVYSPDVLAATLTSMTEN